MHKIKSFGINFIERIKGWSLRKKIFYGILLLVLIFIGYKIFGPKDNSANITTDIVRRENLKQTVLATGQVTSTTDLNLSFSGSGVVKSLKVKVGDKVKARQILATLDQSNELAAYTSARGAVAAAEARYKRTLEGASNEELALARIALENAKLDYARVESQQEILVGNARKNLLNSTPEALPVGEVVNYTAPTITGNYNKTEEGDIIISIYQSSSGNNFSVSGIASGNGSANTTPQPLGDSGLYIQFPSTPTGITQWVVSIPNKKAINYLTNYNAYQSALKVQDSALGSARALVDQRTAELSIKESKARDADIELAKADILTAQGQLQLASANLEHTILRAPSAGTITKVDIKLGELAQASKGVMVLQDIGNLYLEANINEANIANISINAPTELTFDAFGTENIFPGKILTVEPSSTLISGVVNYKITASIDSSPELRPGMTANMTILIAEKDDVLVIPARAVLKNKDGTKTVRIITNTKNKDYQETEIATGMEGDGGLVEVIAGLDEGEEIVVLIKK